MIGRLRGTLVEQEGAMVIVDCGGVGYEVTVSAHTLIALPPVGETVTLRIFTHALENKVALYGFSSAFERRLFDLLITVKKVGPSSAVGMLSAGPAPEEIARLSAGEQITQLTKLRGVGKKTAEMLVVELREKCEKLLLSWQAAGHGGHAHLAPVVVTPGKPARPPLLEDVATALLQLGWRPAEVDKVVSELPTDDGATLETLLRQALRSMPR